MTLWDLDSERKAQWIEQQRRLTTQAWARGERDAMRRIMAAKLFASTAAAKTAARAVELLGAVGFTTRTPVARHFRDSKALEVIEGANEALRIFWGGEYLANRTSPVHESTTLMRFSDAK